MENVTEYNWTDIPEYNVAILVRERGNIRVSVNLLLMVILVSTSAGSVRPIPGDGEPRPARPRHLRSPRHQGQIENREIRKLF